jgi:hypothetical protein
MIQKLRKKEKQEKEDAPFRQENPCPEPRTNTRTNKENQNRPKRGKLNPV